MHSHKHTITGEGMDRFLAELDSLKGSARGRRYCKILDFLADSGHSNVLEDNAYVVLEKHMREQGLTKKGC